MLDGYLEPIDYKAFWQTLVRRHPLELENGPVGGGGTRWRKFDDRKLIVSQTVGETGARVFLRGWENADPAQVSARLVAAEHALEQYLGMPLKTTKPDQFFASKLEVDMRNSANWAVAADWIFGCSRVYEAAVTKYVPVVR